MNFTSKISTLTIAVVAATLAAAAVNCQNNSEPTPTATLATTPTATATEASVPPTLTPTRTPAPELAPTQTPEPTPTRTAVPPTATPRPDIEPTSVPPTVQPTSTPISQPTATPTSDPVPTVQPTPRVEPTVSPTSTPEPTPQVLREPIFWTFPDEQSTNAQFRPSASGDAGTFDISYSVVVETGFLDPNAPQIELNVMCRSRTQAPRRCADDWYLAHQEEEQRKTINVSLPPGWNEVTIEDDGIPLGRTFIFIDAGEIQGYDPTYVEFHTEGYMVDVYAEHQFLLDGSNGLVPRVVGYWSDGSANVEVFASTQSLLPTDTLWCQHENGTDEPCDAELSLTPNNRYTRMQIRLQAGKTHIAVYRDDDELMASDITLSQRSIVGIQPEVLDCFADTTFRDANDRPDSAIGCAGWYDTKIVKWDHRAPMRVKLIGTQDWTNFVRDELQSLGTLFNIQFEWVNDDEPAHIAVYAGISLDQSVSSGVDCGPGAAGCATPGIKVGNANESDNWIVIYSSNTEGEASQPLPTEHWHLDHIRSVVLHEAVHAFTGMGHRIEIGTRMFSHNTEFRTSGQGLSPMDYALIRLHAHPDVFSGMDIANIEHLAVTTDQMLDPDTDASEPPAGYAAWNTVTAATYKMRNTASASYSVATSMPGCNSGVADGTYRVAKLIPRDQVFQWSHIATRNSETFRFTDPTSDPEIWVKNDSQWQQSDNEPQDSGWMPGLSDPYGVLLDLLLAADWNNITMEPADDGSATIVATIRRPSSDDEQQIEATINLETDELTSYTTAWDFDSHECDGYVVNATSGEYDTPFTIPSVIQAESTFVNPCEPTRMPTNPRQHRIESSWQENCPSTDPDVTYGRSFVFTTDSWSLLRLDFQAQGDTYISITDTSSGNVNTVEPSTGIRFLVGLEGYQRFIEYLDWWQFGLPEQGTYVWHHQWLLAGTYEIQAVTRERGIPGLFTMIVDAQPIADSPNNLRFKAVATSVDRTCALTTDGTPLCWGRPHDTSTNSTIPQGKFDQIFGGYHYCATTDDGSAQCWDFKEAGNHECSPNEEVASREVCNLTGQPSFNTEGLIDQAQAFVSGFYYDQSAPGDAAFSRISAGHSHTCGLQTDSSALCWGLEFDGESTPPAGRSFTDIASSSGFSCGLIDGGLIKCWGSDGTGEIITPAESGFQDVGISFAYGETRICALNSLGQVQCFSRYQWSCDPSLPFVRPCSGDQGDFFDPEDPNYVPTPPDLYNPAPNSTFVALSTGAPECGIKADGTAECWHVWPIVTSPPATETFTQISAGKHHACGVRTDGTIACWGENAYGQSTPPNGTYFPNTR